MPNDAGTSGFRADFECAPQLVEASRRTVSAITVLSPVRIDDTVDIAGNRVDILFAGELWRRLPASAEFHLVVRTRSGSRFPNLAVRPVITRDFPANEALTHRRCRRGCEMTNPMERPGEWRIR